MNIKSLLLGSAAALVAVSGARAADVIVPVAPEPVEYVKVCDVYGTGFYYIPGTETCLKIGGYVRYQITANGGISDDFGNDFLVNNEGDTYQVGSQVRVRLNFDAREETELGTLRAFARVQATNLSGSNNTYAMDQGYLQLGGLTMGKLDSLWAEDDGLLTDTDLSVGDVSTNQIRYTYAADGFSAAVSIDDDSTGDWIPNVVGQLKYSGGWGFVYLSGSYAEDEAFQVASPTVIGVEPGSDDAFALKAGLSLKDLIATDSELKIEGSYAFDPSVYSQINVFRGFQNTVGAYTLPGNVAFNGSDLFDTLPVEWQVGAGYAQSFGKLGVAVSGAYGETFDIFANTTNLGNANYYKFVGNVGYEVTKNFDVLAEVAYTKLDFDSNLVGLADDSADQTTGFLRFVRSF